MLESSQKMLNDMTYEAPDYNSFKDIMKSTRGFIKAYWCEDKNCESAIKEETKASTRCLPLDSTDSSGKCVYCEKDAKHIWYFGQAY